MAMQKAHSSIPWVDYPKLDTPLNAQNLLKEDKAIDVIDDRVISLDTTKFDKTEAAKLIRSITFNRQNGVFTITYYSGATATIDTMLEKLAVNFDYEEETQRLVITLDDGTIKYIDISALIQKDEFVDTETIAFKVDSKGKVSAIVKEGSIEEKHLRPDYLADIRVESAKAVAAKEAAETAQAEAKKSQTAAATSATQSATSAKSSADSATASAGSATTATEQAASASNSAKAAKTSETNAAQSASNAQTSAETATRQATVAGDSANTATTQANSAKTSATSASNSAKDAQSYAVGGTNRRENEDSDNAKYYYEQAKHIIQGVNGIVNMGTVKFADLPTNPEVNQMYNISDAFTSDEKFQDGSGIHYAAGNNVVWTGDEKWDVLAASQVLSVNGKTGAVTVTKADVGLGNVENTADINKNVNSAKTATTADKVKNALTFTGAVSATYNGSEAKTVNIPANTDTKVTETLVSDNATYPLLLGTKGLNKTATTTACFDSGVTLNPSNNTIAASISGKAATAGTADKVAHALTFSGTASGTFDGSAAKTVDVQSTTGNTANNTVAFTSGDASSATGWTNVSVIATGEKHSSLFNKISTMCKNVRWLFSRLGSTDISKIGDGTVTGAISALNSSSSDCAPKEGQTIVSENVASGSYYTATRTGYVQVWFKWSEEGNWIELLIYNDKNALVNAAQRSLHRSGYKNTMGLPILKGQRCLVQFVGMTDVRFDFFY